MFILQVTYQLKILATALFSVIMLIKKLSGVQWGSLVILFVGVALVQVQSISATSKLGQEQNQLVGLLAVIISCLSSGFAGVYVEKMLKQTSASLWLRNVQLSMFGALTGLMGMFLKDWGEISWRGGGGPCLVHSSGLVGNYTASIRGTDSGDCGEVRR